MFGNKITIQDYQICKRCSTDTTLVWHSDGNCPNSYHRCVICDSDIKKGTPFGIKLPEGSAYNNCYLCCVCIDAFISETKKLRDMSHGMF